MGPVARVVPPAMWDNGAATMPESTTTRFSETTGWNDETRATRIIVFVVVIVVVIVVCRVNGNAIVITTASAATRRGDGQRDHDEHAAVVPEQQNSRGQQDCAVECHGVQRAVRSRVRFDSMLCVRNQSRALLSSLHSIVGRDSPLAGS